MTSQSPWRLVFFYFDETDPRVWVPKRTNLGWTLNLAHRASWLILGALVVAVAAAAAVGARALIAH